jgi:hypothetical protein
MQRLAAERAQGFTSLGWLSAHVNVEAPAPVDQETIARLQSGSQEMTDREKELWQTFESGDYTIELDSFEDETEAQKRSEFESMLSQYSQWRIVDRDPEEAATQLDLEEAFAAETERDVAIQAILESTGMSP